MATFVDYSRRRQKFLGYRGFENALMSDLDLRKMMSIGQEIAGRMVSPSVDLNQLESAIRSYNTSQLASVIGFSTEGMQARLNELYSSAINLRNRYSQLIDRNIKKNINKKEDVIMKSISIARNKINEIDWNSLGKTEGAPPAGGNPGHWTLECNEPKLAICILTGVANAANPLIWLDILDAVVNTLFCTAAWCHRVYVDSHGTVWHGGGGHW